MFIKNNKGFSLIEILVTIGIVAVLGSIAVPAYNQYKNNANETAVKADVGNSQRAYLAKDAVDGSFCYPLSDVGLAALGESDIYTKAEKFFIGFTGSCTRGTTTVNTGLSKASGTAMGHSGCTISTSGFNLGGGFEKGNQKVGYYVSQTDAGPNKSTNQSANCSAKPTKNCTKTTESDCLADSANCQWNAGGISDICN